MADIAITAANVLQSTNAAVTQGVAGATITQGQVVYLDPADQKYKLSKANGASPLNTVAGVALTGSAAGQPILVCLKDSNFKAGGTLIPGETICLSDTAGNICPDADPVTGSTKIVLGIALTTTNMILAPLVGGIVP